MKYRAEIDGLRAVAVLPVIFFHAGFQLFGGGFVGVDIFFVISGYLITTILIEEIDQQKFSIVTFYERRARRILPALFFMMICAFPFAWMLMLPSDMELFAHSLIAVSLFVSNFLYWQESDYFAGNAEENPMLHTWSLAVEEQYYLFFPVFLFFAWRFGRQRVFWLIVVFSAISLALAEYAWRHHPSANFYLAPTRLWELFAGSIAAFLVRQHGVRANNLWSLAGLVMVAVAIFLYDKNTPFPSIYTLVPVLGVFLLVLYSGPGTYTTRLLSNRLFVGIGLISYSAYLWHQPVLAFLRIGQIDHPSLLQMCVAIAAVTVLAYLSWKYVENPFRNKARISRKAIFSLSGIFIVAFSALGIVLSANLEKLSVGQSSPLILGNVVEGFNSDNRDLQKKSWTFLYELSGTEDYGVRHNPFDDALWFSLDDARRKMLIVGNSHSKDLYNVLVSSQQFSNAFEVARFGTQIKDVFADGRLFQSENYQHANVVVFATRYSMDDVASLNKLVDKIRSDGKQVVLVKNIFEYREFQDSRWNLIDQLVYENYATTPDKAELADLINRTYYEYFVAGKTSQKVKAINQRLQELGDELSIDVWDRMEYVCDHDTKRCFAVDETLNKYFYDYGHQTLQGAVFSGQHADAIGWFDDKLPGKSE